MARVKSTEKKRDFIKILSSMRDVEINDFILKNGKPPKQVIMCRLLKKDE